MTCWHHTSTAAVLSELATQRAAGLSSHEAEERLNRYGPNELAAAPGRSLLLRFLDQFKDPMILVLLAAAVLSVVAGGGKEWVDAIIILVIIVVNAAISIVQEQSAEKALEALGKMAAPKAHGMGAPFCWTPHVWCPATSYCWRPATGFRRMGDWWRAPRSKRTNPP